MASSKKLFLLLGLLFAIVLISSAASEKTVKSNGIEEVNYGGVGHGNIGGARRILQGGCPNGCCRRQRVFRCLRCCSSPDEIPDAEHEDDIKN